MANILTLAQPVSENWNHQVINHIVEVIRFYTTRNYVPSDLSQINPANIQSGEYENLQSQLLNYVRQYMPNLRKGDVILLCAITPPQFITAEDILSMEKIPTTNDYGLLFWDGAKAVGPQLSTTVPSPPKYAILNINNWVIPGTVEYYPNYGMVPSIFTIEDGGFSPNHWFQIMKKYPLANYIFLNENLRLQAKQNVRLDEGASPISYILVNGEVWLLKPGKASESDNLNYYYNNIYQYDEEFLPELKRFMGQLLNKNNPFEIQERMDYNIEYTGELKYDEELPQETLLDYDDTIEPGIGNLSIKGYLKVYNSSANNETFEDNFNMYDGLVEYFR